MNQLNISYRPNILFLTVLIYTNSSSYSKQTISQVKKQVFLGLKKYYTCQTYTLDLQKTFDIAVVYVIWHISLGCIHQNNIYSCSETSGGNIFVIITMLYRHTRKRSGRSASERGKQEVEAKIQT